MDINFLSNEPGIALIIIGVLMFYYIYYYSAESVVVKRFLRRNTSPASIDLILFFYKKMNGFVFLGVLPAILYFFVLNASGEKFGLSFNHLTSSFLLIAGLILLTAFILFFHHHRKPHRSTLQLNPEQWNSSLFILNVLGWSFYLVAYEFLFRGILLFECYEDFGFWPAVAINVSIYSAIHMVYGKDQAIGALIFGTIACYFALTRGTILIPVFMHLSVSILSNYYSVRNIQRFGMNDNNSLKIHD